jgi:hypothetical protein
MDRRSISALPPLLPFRFQVSGLRPLFVSGFSPLPSLPLSQRPVAPLCRGGCASRLSPSATISPDPAEWIDAQSPHSPLFFLSGFKFQVSALSSFPVSALSRPSRCLSGQSPPFVEAAVPAACHPPPPSTLNHRGGARDRSGGTRGSGRRQLGEPNGGRRTGEPNPPAQPLSNPISDLPFTNSDAPLPHSPFRTPPHLPSSIFPPPSAQPSTPPAVSAAIGIERPFNRPPSGAVALPPTSNFVVARNAPTSRAASRALPCAHGAWCSSVDSIWRWQFRSRPLRAQTEKATDVAVFGRAKDLPHFAYAEALRSTTQSGPDSKEESV